MLHSLYTKRNIGLLDAAGRIELVEREAHLNKLKKELAKTKASQARQIACRAKAKLNNVRTNIKNRLDEAATTEPARPSAETQALIDAISRIAMHGSAAHEQRRTDVIRSVKTLTQLTEALRNQGWKVTSLPSLTTTSVGFY